MMTDFEQWMRRRIGPEGLRGMSNGELVPPLVAILAVALFLVML